MFTDIVGYAALTQQKESEALQILEQHRELLRPIFAKHRGREVKTIGDAFLVEFGSALEATLCAVDVQNSVHSLNLERGGKLQVRIGIHVGDVVRQGDDVLGDAVNISSRIYPLAESGGVCISEQVYDQVKNKLELPLVSLGEKSLKNVAGGVEVYRVSMPWDQEKEAAPPRLDKNRIAVLPFANISSDPNDEFLADGMTEEMISTASSIKGLTLIARTSVMRYKSPTKGIEEIGRELQVGTVLEGSIQKAGNKLRITAQLIDVESLGHLWVQRYDREMDDIFKIQDDIAGKIAEALRVRFKATQEPVGKHAENIEAYTLYLKGRSLWNKWDREGVLGSLKLFQEAIKIDPYYARAYSGLADAYSVVAERTYSIAAERDFVDRADTLVRAKQAAMKALELDDTLAEAHASLGGILRQELRYEEALREFRRAIELNPSYATAHRWFSACLGNMGRIEESTEEIEEARELDPLSPVITLNVGETYANNGRIDEAIVVYDKLIKNEPAFPFSYWHRALCFMFKGMKEKAYTDADAWGKSLPVEVAEAARKDLLAKIHGWFGEREKALIMIEELIPKVGTLTSAFDIAECYAALGDRDKFFRWIDRAIFAKGIDPVNLRYSHLYDRVREDPRFPEIFKKLGLSY
jgi:adenylate cyclase